jgi:adenylosuccinate synthase
MHLDTLSGLKELKICKAYKIDGNRTQFFPSNEARLSKVQCIYETLKGWDEDITEITNFDDLPAGAKKYVITKLYSDDFRLFAEVKLERNY